MEPFWLNAEAPCFSPQGSPAAHQLFYAAETVEPFQLACPKISCTLNSSELLHTSCCAPYAAIHGARTELVFLCMRCSFFRRGNRQSDTVTFTYEKIQTRRPLLSVRNTQGFVCCCCCCCCFLCPLLLASVSVLRPVGAWDFDLQSPSRDRHCTSLVGSKALTKQPCFVWSPRV